MPECAPPARLRLTLHAVHSSLPRSTLPSLPRSPPPSLPPWPPPRLCLLLSSPLPSHPPPGSLRRRRHLPGHPAEPVEPHLRCVGHTHIHPGAGRWCGVVLGTCAAALRVQPRSDGNECQPGAPTPPAPAPPPSRPSSRCCLTPTPTRPPTPRFACLCRCLAARCRIGVPPGKPPGRRRECPHAAPTRPPVHARPHTRHTPALGLHPAPPAGGAAVQRGPQGVQPAGQGCGGGQLGRRRRRRGGRG